MSNQRMKNGTLSSFDGNRWAGPFFSDKITELHAAFAALAGYVDLQSLDRAAKTCGLSPFPRNGKLTTDDRYCWFWYSKFLVHGGCVLMALPHCNDGTMADGTNTDRSTAAYFVGNVAFREIDDVAANLRRNLPEPSNGGNPLKIEWGVAPATST